MSSSFDVVVVGAGPAGFVAAERLRELGLKSLVLEAGPRLQAGQRLGEVDRRAWAFRSEPGPFDWYRVRAVGGRAHLWGGWCYRFPDVVLRRVGLAGASTLAPEYAVIERQLGVIDGIVDERYDRAARELGVKILPKRAPLTRSGHVWKPFVVRSTPNVRPNHVALRIEHTRGRADAVVCLDLRTEKQVTITAPSFVIAASPIETARVLLESSLPDAGIGRGFVDHLVASYLLIEPRPAPSAEGRGAFPGSALVESFVNVDRPSQRRYPGGFSIELTGPVPLETYGIERMVPESELASHSVTQVHALGESAPHERRFVALDPSRRDALDRRIPIIHSAMSDEDALLAADMKTACASFADAIATRGSRLIPFVDPLQPGAGHEAGTCAMGTSESSPCDATGRLRALANVWIADASALRTAGDRHPTLTILAHARRVANAMAAARASARAHAKRTDPCTLPDRRNSTEAP